MIHEFLKSLKAGKVVLMPSDIGPILLADIRQPQALALLKELKTASKTNPYTIVTAEIGLLQSFAPKLPQVGLDIIEFEEHALTVLTKEVDFDDNYSPIALRLVKTSLLLDLLVKIGRPLLSIALKSDKIDDALRSKVEILEPLDHSKPQKHKVIFLGHDGEIQFID